MKAIVLFSIVAFGVAALPVVAGTRDDVMDASARCAAVQEDHAWLDCYYGAAQAMRSHLGLSPAPQGQVALVPPAGSRPPPSRVQAAPPKPGFFTRLLAHEEVDREPMMTAYNFDRSHLFTVSLSDGTVWRQSPQDQHRAAWRKPPGSYHVSVQVGYGGVGTLDPNDGFQYQVQRVH
jgi:hypothetical protein